MSKLVEMKLQFFGGANTIGGNKILLEADDTKLFFDFGLDYAEYGKYFEEYLKPRVANGFGDFLALGLIPSPKELQGLYREDLLKISGFPVHEEPEFDGILLSHAHFDHSANITFVDERVPIYASEITIAMAKAVQECGTPSFDLEIYCYKRRPILKRGEPPVERDWRSVESGKKFKVGNLEVKPFAVDHSIPGAMSYLVYTSEGTIFYTGDIRKHGTYGYLTEKMLEELADEEINIMLCEGTRVNEVENQSEQLVKSRANEIIKNCKQLVVADYAYKDLTRFKTFYEIAKENNRKLAIGLKDAYIIKELSDLVDIPKLDDDNLVIYLDKRGSGTYKVKDYNRKWMKELLDLDNKVNAEEIRKKQNKVIIRLGFFSFTNLVDLKPNPGSQYIHSMCEAFNEEMAISEERMKNWLKHFGLPYNFAHCSGHANALELKGIINAIKPKVLMPIHTLYPEKFRDLVGKETEVKFPHNIQF